MRVKPTGWESRSWAPLPAPGSLSGSRSWAPVPAPGPLSPPLGPCWGHGPEPPSPPLGPCRGRGPMPLPHPWVPIPHPHRSPAAQEAQHQLGQLALHLLEGQHRPRHLPWQGALWAQRSREVAEERVQEAGGLLCRLAVLLWGPRGHTQGIGGAGELLLGSLVFSLRGDVRVSAQGWG